jgi:hypothetical protein
MSIYLGVGKNLSISICASKGKSIETTNQGFRIKGEMQTTLENRKKVETNSSRNVFKKKKKVEEGGASGSRMKKEQESTKQRQSGTICNANNGT